MTSLLLALLSQFDAGSVLDHCRVTVVDPVFLDSGYATGPVIDCDLPVYAPRFANTEDQRDAGHVMYKWANGSGVTMPAYLVGASQNGAPSVVTMPGRVNETYGWVEYGDAGTSFRSGYEIYCLSPEGDGRARNGNSCLGVGAYPSSDKIVWWDVKGSYFSAGGDMTYMGDDNEKHVVTRTTGRPGAASRLQFKGSDPTGGPSVYVAKDPGSPGDVFQVIADGVAAGFTTNAGVRVGKTYSLPACNSATEGVILYHGAAKCFEACDGITWRCLDFRPE